MFICDQFIKINIQSCIKYIQILRGFIYLQSYSIYLVYLTSYSYMTHPLSDNASCLTNYQWPPLVITQSGILTLCEWTCSSPPRTSGVVSPWYWMQSWTRCLQCVAECSPLACYVPVYQMELFIIYNIRYY